MAIDRTGITSLDAGAGEITYSGNEGPKSPDQQLMAQADPMLVERYQQYVFEMEEQGLQPMSFREFMQEAMSGMATGGRAGYANGQLVKPGPGRPGYGGPHETYEAGKSYSSSNEETNRERAIRAFATKGSTNIHSVGKAEDPYIMKGGDIHYQGSPTYNEEIQKSQDIVKESQKSLLDKHNDWRAEQARKSFKKLMLHKMKGSPFTLPSMLAAFKGAMDDEDFEEEYGVSYEDFSNMSPMQMEAIFGSVKDKVSQAERDDIRRLSEGLGRDDLYKQDVWEDIYYGDKGPPDLTGGGDGPQPIIYPYQTASVPETDTDTPTDVDPITGFPTDPIRFASNQPSAHDFTGIYGQRTIPVKDGGRIGYAGGGIADLRQGYFLGKLVKKAGRALKKVVKSPIGKIGLGILGAKFLGPKLLAGYGGENAFLKALKGGKLLGETGIFRNIPGANILMGGKGYADDAWNPWKLGILGMSMYPLIAGTGDDDDKDFTQTDLYKKWLAQKQGWDQTFAGVGDPANFQRMRLYSADGGRIGYAGGYMVDDEDEEDHRSAALAAMYKNRMGAQEGGLMDMGGMEKDYRNEGGFVPIGGQERADDVPARLSKNEFVFTADAVRNAGGGDIDKGAEIMENLMENLEKGGKVSEESQGLEGARDMFATSQRLEGVL